MHGESNPLQTARLLYSSVHPKEVVQVAAFAASLTVRVVTLHPIATPTASTHAPHRISHHHHITTGEKAGGCCLGTV